jgi:hypothetical protein
LMMFELVLRSLCFSRILSTFSRASVHHITSKAMQL